MALLIVLLRDDGWLVFCGEATFLCFGEGWNLKACGVVVSLFVGDVRCAAFAESDAVGEEFRVEFSVELSVVELSVELEL